MNAFLHTNLPLHAVAIFCLAACFLSFYWGYGKNEREIQRARRKFVKDQEAKLPRVVR